VEYTLSLEYAETVRTTLVNPDGTPNLRYLSFNLGSDLVHLTSLIGLVEQFNTLKELQIAYFSLMFKEGMYENAAQGEPTPFLKPQAYNFDDANLDGFLENFCTCLRLPRPFCIGITIYDSYNEDVRKVLGHDCYEAEIPSGTNDTQGLPYYYKCYDFDGFEIETDWGLEETCYCGECRRIQCILNRR
jgi:hypothetical protein